MNGRPDPDRDAQLVERLLGRLADPLDQLVTVGEVEREMERLGTDLAAHLQGFLDARLPPLAAVLARELVDPGVLRPALAGFLRSFADALEAG